MKLMKYKGKKVYATGVQITLDDINKARAEIQIVKDMRFIKIDETGEIQRSGFYDPSIRDYSSGLMVVLESSPKDDILLIGGIDAITSLHDERIAVGKKVISYRAPKKNFPVIGFSLM